ncbi:MAG: hypothetical protein HRU41_22875 [Saprospiraceae bacterium]|nr:hypothetical protein [Saprospiraceae bacterium]
MKTLALWTILLAFLPMGLAAQFRLDWNAWVDLELSEAQANSHYFYNQIHKDHLGWRLGFSDINLVTTAQLDSSWTVQVRAQLKRNAGQALNEFLLPAAFIQYQPRQQSWRLALGRFITPFGSFTERQHPKDRTFINIPLAYSFYQNIAAQIGFATDLGETKTEIDETVLWGTTMVYYGGYTQGLRFDWDIDEDDQWIWSLAIGNSAPNILDQAFNTENWGISTRLQYRPAYFWEQGLSFGSGSFVQNSSLFNRLPSNPQQWLLGTDWRTGIGFWELTGELISAWYRSPIYDRNTSDFEQEEVRLNSLAFSSQIRYETPFLSGLYLAYRFDIMTFSKVEDQRWDEQVTAHNLGLGYKLNRFLLLRLNYLLMDKSDRPVWEQNTFRSTLTLHF